MIKMMMLGSGTERKFVMRRRHWRAWVLVFNSTVSKNLKIIFSLSLSLWVESPKWNNTKYKQDLGSIFFYFYVQKKYILESKNLYWKVKCQNHSASKILWLPWARGFSLHLWLKISALQSQEYSCKHQQANNLVSKDIRREKWNPE